MEKLLSYGYISQILVGDMDYAKALLVVSPAGFIGPGYGYGYGYGITLDVKDSPDTGESFTSLATLSCALPARKITCSDRLTSFF